MIHLMIIRHGETDWNLERRLQGSIDIPLNRTGLRQGAALAAALHDAPLDTIVCSDLQRAIQTAQLIAAPKKLRCQIRPGWRERSFGGFEGEPINMLEQRFPKEYAAWRNYEVDSHFPQNPNGSGRGETIREFNARIESALRQLAQEFDGQKVAVVAHGGVLECAYRLAQQLPLNAPRLVSMLNASINRFELALAGEQVLLKLVQWGDVSHLETALDELA